MSNFSENTIHADYLHGSSHTVYAVNFAEIIESYSSKHWDVLKEELISIGNVFLCERGDFAFFEINSGDAPHEYIHLSWNELVGKLNCVEHE